MLTTQHALKRLTLVCDCEEAVSAMSQLSCFELTLLEDICLKLAAGSTLCKLFDECKKASWEDIDRALCGDKFTRFRSLVISSTETISRGDLHDVFKNPLPESYRCGKLWFSDGISMFFVWILFLSVLTLV